MNYIEALDNHVKIVDQGQTGSTSIDLSKGLTSTSTPKDVQVNTSLQSKQKSTIKPDKPLTSNLFGYQNNTPEDDTYIPDTEDKELKLGKSLPPPVNQRVRKKDQIQAQNQYNGYNTYFDSLNDNREHQDMYWEQQTHNYRELKDEITEKVTNHTNKLIDNLENKLRQINENIERKQEEAFGTMFNQERQQEEALETMFNRLIRTLDDINRQNNLSTETRKLENNNIQNNRHPEDQTRRTKSITTEERETTVTEPPLPFYKQLTSMSINEEPQIEQNISSGSVPTTIRPFDGTNPAYTVEEYLNSIVAAMIISSGIEPVTKPGHHQWKVKRAALIFHTLQRPAQKWYSTLPSETKVDWEIYCKEFSDMFDSEKSKQQAKTVLQQLQKHTKESLRSLALRIETLVKTAYSLYTEDYRNSVMNQFFIRCLDNELKNSSFEKTRKS